MAAYAILRLNWDVHTANDTLLTSIPKKLAFFRDYHGDSNFKLNILDCLKGLYFGCKVNQWFLSRNACVTSKVYDMDWIVPNKLLALRDPTIRRETRRRQVSKIAVRELKRLGITSIIRLNGEDHNHCLDYYGYSYQVDDITKEHFIHYEIPFEDVNVPTIQQVNQFITFCEVTNGRVGVHCHAGLGRSAAMIGCYMIKHYGFDGRSVCAWMKMCRSGSVMGPQHFFFERYEQYLKMHRDTGIIKRDYIINTSTTHDGPQPARRISRPPRKNNIIHIVPGNKRELKKVGHSEKTDTTKKNDIEKVVVHGRTSSRTTSSTNRKSSKSLTGTTATERSTTKVEKRPPRATSTSKFISSVMRASAAAIPPCPKQSRKDSSIKSYKIPTNYVNMEVQGKSAAGTKKANTKGPTFMKGTLSRSYETLETAKDVVSTSNKNINSSISWSPRGSTKHSMMTRSLAKQLESSSSHRRR